ncbi:NUDIX domain-containing protein [Gordonia effusa]|uniref:NUDIX domain-containing protein n=1 Tax=Gordonia effusa TaxID=263908 RepID=UPI001FDEC30A|nr:NUDIX domain-containing protein [Gordonia effusa]
MPRSRLPSAGILLFRLRAGAPEFLIVHPGGPLWSKKDAGAWSIPKGEYRPDDDPLEAAKREFTEEIGFPVPDGPLIELGDVTLKSGKVVTGYALEGDIDEKAIVSNKFELEWPPRSGRTQSFPEVDKAMWATFAAARRKLNPAQAEFLVRLLSVEIPSSS